MSMSLLNLVVVVLISAVLAEDPGTLEAELHNAEQSSTSCYNGVGCFNASRAIDGFPARGSRTEWGTETPWWQASLAKKVKVHQVILRAATFRRNATVALLRNETVVGTCESYTPKMHWETVILKCDRVKANGVRVTVNSPNKTTEYLIVGEIKVIGHVEHVQQLHLDPASAKQNSEGWEGAAARAIDGNTNGYYWNNSCTHSARGSLKDNWWSVNLAGGAKSVTRVVIYNRVDKCYKCPQRINGAKVYVGDVECGKVKYVEGVSEYKVECDGAVGSEVKIVQKNNYLTLCEVEVYGIDAGQELVKRSRGNSRRFQLGE